MELDSDLVADAQAHRLPMGRLGLCPFSFSCVRQADICFGKCQRGKPLTLYGCHGFTKRLSVWRFRIGTGSEDVRHA